ncbi:MAG: 50S ribosomal protein L23 [Enterobacterales bacterium]
MANEERLLKIIQGSHISEKSSRFANKNNTVVLKVLKNAHKSEIKEAIYKIFKVKVIKLSTLIIKGKKKRFGKRIGFRNDWKKAYVTINKMYKLNLDSNIKYIKEV